MGKSNDIRAAVIDDLTFDPDVDASDIRVEEMDGEVVLTGSVPSYPQYVQAAAVAARGRGRGDDEGPTASPFGEMIGNDYEVRWPSRPEGFVVVKGHGFYLTWASLLACPLGHGTDGRQDERHDQ